MERADVIWVHAPDFKPEISQTLATRLHEHVEAGAGLMLTLLATPLVVPLALDAMGGVDRLAGLVSAELVAVWSVFLMRQFFLTLPREI